MIYIFLQEKSSFQGLGMQKPQAPESLRLKF